jgi:hypothetical protein
MEETNENNSCNKCGCDLDDCRCDEDWDDEDDYPDDVPFIW